MATAKDIKDTVYSELVTVINGYLSGTSNADHVRVTNRYEDGPFPALTFETFDTDVNYGMGSGVQVDDVVRNADDTIDKIVVRRDKEMRVDVGAHVAGDDERAVDELYADVEEQFTPLVEDVGERSNTLHSDVERLRLRGTTDVSQPSDAVRGERLRLDIEYKHYIDIMGIDTMEQIDTNFDVIVSGGTDADFDTLTNT